MLSSSCAKCRLPIISLTNAKDEGNVWQHDSPVAISSEFSAEFLEAADRDHIPVPLEDQLTPEEEKKITNLINGGLKDTINVHGPITQDFVTSASKRVLGMLKGHTKIDVINPISTKKSK